MKKLTIIAVMLMVSAAAFGQSNFKFGVTGGMNVSKVHQPNVVFKSDNIIGWYAGLLGEMSFANNIYGNVAVQYSHKGYKYPRWSEDSEDKTDGTYNYIEAPIHIGYKYSVTKTIGILGEVGPTFGYLSSAKGTDEGYKWKGTEDLNKLIVNVGFKVGAEFNDRFRLTLGYDWGLSNNYKDFNGWKEKNRNFNVGMVLFF